MLEAKHVSKSYRHGRSTLQVLSDVSLAIAAGERVGLVGASGAGKSTLAQIIALLMRPDAGTVSVDGRVIQGAGLRVPPDVRRNVQLIWQSPRMSSDPRFTLRQILSEPLESLKGPERAQAAKRIPDLLDRVGLTGDLLDRRPHAVSDGQLQRACLIRALVLEPKYLICDEFTAMLDASTQAALLNTLGDEQARTGMGIVLITHDHKLARHWCHRIIQVADGRLIEARPPLARASSSAHPASEKAEAHPTELERTGVGTGRDEAGPADYAGRQTAAYVPPANSGTPRAPTPYASPARLLPSNGAPANVSQPDTAGLPKPATKPSA